MKIEKTYRTIQGHRMCQVDKTADKYVSGVYGAFDASDDTVLYVGMSRNVGQRVAAHISQLKNSSQKKKHWDDKYKNSDAANNVEWLVIEFVDDVKILNERENYWHKKLCPLFNAATVSSKCFTSGRTGKKLSKEALEKRLKHESPSQIADSLRVTKTMVYQWMKSYGISYTAKRYTNSGIAFVRENIVVDEVVSMIDERVPMTEIADRYGFSRVALMKVLDEMNIVYGRKFLIDKITSIPDLEKDYETLSIKQIARKYNVPVSIVREELLNRGLSLRTSVDRASIAGQKRVEQSVVQRDNKGRFIS